MKALSRVVWSEGMHLAQHHFQLQARYFEDLAHFSFGALRGPSYGLLDVSLDAEALTNGTVSLLEGTGLMPDGLAFQFPNDPLPEPLPVADGIAPTKDYEDVVLRVSVRHDLDTGQSPDMSARFEAMDRTVMDEVTGEFGARVTVGRKRLRLGFAHRAAPDSISMPIARVRRDGKGGFRYDDEFIPPCLRVGASANLRALVRQLVDTLSEKSRTLTKAGRSTGDRDFGGREIATLWLKHAVHTGLATLRHHAAGPMAHPEELYLDLVRLSGALCTFGFESDAASLPTYDHDDLGRVFSQLDRHIRRHLDLVRPTRRPVVHFEREEPNVYTTTVTDTRALHPDAIWYLGVSGDGPSSELVRSGPGLIKVCPARHLERALRDSRPGMELTHEPSPPADIDPRPGCTYFRIATKGGISGGWWSMIIDVDESEGVPRSEVGRIGAYAPASFGDVELELAFLRPG